MRPVERGLAPQVYNQYQDAIADLEVRLGNYCSYCERRLPVSLAVEHLLPKVFRADLETEWTNFLLGCANCNSVKGMKEVEISNCLWPDRDNTFLAFDYLPGGFIQPADNINSLQRIKAQALLDLVGLQRHQASGWDKPSPRDKRWQQREEVWKAAEQCLDYFKSLGQNVAARELVLQAAQGYGFFSVWMTVFKDYPDIKRELIRLFPGTALNCFDSDGEPIDREFL